jgi:hypothetical protein
MRLVLKARKPTWYVHIGAVDVVARGQIAQFLAVCAHSLLAGPGLVPPWEEDEE